MITMLRRVLATTMVLALLCLSVSTAVFAEMYRELPINENAYVTEWSAEGDAKFMANVSEAGDYVFYFDCVEKGVVATQDGEILGEDAWRVEVTLQADVDYIVTLYENEYSEEGYVYFTTKTPVEAIELFRGKDTVWMSLGQTMTMQYELFPSYATYEDITFSVADSAVALPMGTEVMAVGTGKTTVTATTESGATDDIALIVKPAIAFDVDGEGMQSVAITPQHTSHTFALTVKTSGTYLMFAESPYDTIGELYTKKFLSLGSDDDSFGSNFCFEAELTAGETYYLTVSMWGTSHSAGSIDVTVCEVPADDEKGVFDVYPDSVTLAVGDWWIPYYDLDVTDALGFGETTDWDVVTVGIGTDVLATAVGTATVTFNAESGQSDTVEVTVVDTPSLTVGEAVAVPASPDAYREYAYSFTAPADGTYIFKTIGMYTSLYLFDEENGQYEATKDCETDSGVALSLDMTSGQTLTVYSNSAIGDGYQLVALGDVIAPQSVSLGVYEGSALLEQDGIPVFYTETGVPLQVLYDDAITTAFEAYTLTADADGVYGYDNVVYAEYEGTYEVTLTTDSGLTDSVTVRFIKAVAGDINVDGKLNIADAVQLYYHVNGKTLLSEASLLFADYSGDNQLSIVDAVQLYYKVNGK